MLSSILVDSEIFVDERISLDWFIRENRLDHNEAITIEKDLRKDRSLPLLKWKTEYKENHEHLFKDHPVGIPKSEKDNLWKTYVETKRISAETAEVIAIVLEKKYHPTPKEYIVSDIRDYDFIISDLDPDTGKKKLFLMKSSGKKKVLIKNFEGDQLNPCISKDKKWLVFQKGFEKSRIFVVNLKEKKVINKQGFEGKMPSVSPDGKKIVYLPLRFGDDKYLETKNLKYGEITRGKDVNLPSVFTTVTYPVFLSNSKMIAFIGAIGQKRKNIFLYDPDKLFSYRTVGLDKNIRYVTDRSDTHYSLTASLNSFFLLYMVKKELYLTILDSNDADTVKKKIGLRAKFPTFSLNDEQVLYISSDNQIVSQNLICKKGRFKNISERKKVVKANLKQPQKIIFLKGELQ